jgi:hypothetical protein
MWRGLRCMWRGARAWGEGARGEGCAACEGPREGVARAALHARRARAMARAWGENARANGAHALADAASRPSPAAAAAASSTVVFCRLFMMDFLERSVELAAAKPTALRFSIAAYAASRAGLLG